MNVIFEADDALIDTLDRVAGVQKMSRDAAITAALKTWVAHRPKSADWPKLPRLGYDPDFKIVYDRPGPQHMPEFESFDPETQRHLMSERPAR